MPCYEGFGGLPTDLVRRPEDLDHIDMLIIPPGNIVETKSTSVELAEAVKRFAENGGLILGVCSGMQLLSREVDTGARRIECLNLIDASIRKLIALDWADVEIIGSTWLTRGLVGKKIRGLHIHTYGLTEGSARPFLKSYLPRHNYFSGPISLFSGFVGRNDNVLGILPHFILDHYPEIRDNLLRELGVSDYKELAERNRELRRKIKRELGINTGVRVEEEKRIGCKKVIAIVSGETGEGKTFIATGIAGALHARGYRVAVAKLGSDLRDLHPALYLMKKPVSPSMGVMIAGSRGVYGWVPWRRALEELLGASDVLVVETVMGLLTGYSRRTGCSTPSSTLEFLECSRIPVVLVVSCRRGGVEDAVERASLYLDLLSDRKIPVVSVVLNEFYGGREEFMYAEKLRSKTRVFIVPRAGLGRARVPEVDLDIDRFSLEALRAVSQSVNPEFLLSSTPCYDLGCVT